MNPGSQKGIRIVMGGLGLFALALLGVALVGLDLSPLIVLGLALGGVALPILVLRPEAGLHLFLLLTTFEAVGGENQNVTVTKLAGGLILGSWLLSVAVSRRIHLDTNLQVLAFLAFVGVSALSIIQAYDNDVAIRQTLTYLQLVVVMLMVGSVVRSTAAVQRVLGTLVIVMTCAASYGLMQYALGQAKNTAGFVGNRNLMATYLTFAIPCAYLLYLRRRNGLERLGILAALAILFVGLALTFSRSGVIALGIVIAVLGYHLTRQRGLQILAAIFIVIVLVSLALPDAFYERVGTITSSVQRQEDTFGQRVQLAAAGMRMISDHPVLGVGAGNYPVVLARYGRTGYILSGQWASHNTYIGVAAESGIPALALFLLAIAAAFKSLQVVIRSGRLADPHTAALAIAVQTSLIAFVITALSGNIEKIKLLYVFLGLALSLGGIRQRREAAAPRPSAAPGLEATPAGAP